MVVPQTQRPALSGTALKRLALVSMLLDHLGASLLEAGRFTTAVPPAASLYSGSRAKVLPEKYRMGFFLLNIPVPHS